MNKLIPVSIAGVLCASMMSGIALAEQVNFTASTHVNRGTCTFTPAGTTGNELTLDFGNVSPIQAFAGNIVREKTLSLDNCVAVNNLTVNLTATSTVDVTNNINNTNAIGKWIKPTTGATGVAFKTEMKNGSTGSYYKLQANGVTPDTGSDKFTPQWDLYLKATLIPTVATASAMVSGSLLSAAVLNINYQ